MTTRIMFLFALFASLFLTSCKKDLKDEQIQQDVDQIYILTAKRFSSGNLNCTFAVSDVAKIEELTRDEKVEIKVRISAIRNCVAREIRNPLEALGGSFDDNMANRKPGVFVYQECLSLSYEIFDNGFKLRNTSVDDTCPESADFKASQKTRLETLLKETALAACTCKHTNCAEQAIMDECGVREEKDLNGDGINELLVSDTCQGNGPICNANLWSIIEGVPTVLFADSPSIKDVQLNSDGSFPILVDIDGSVAGTAINYFYAYSSKSKKYTLRKKTTEKVRKIFFVGLDGSEVFIDNNKFGELKSAKSGDAGELVLNNLPARLFRVEIRKTGYKTFSFDWDWDNIPRVFTGGDGAGYINQTLDKE